jgi:hypothetical protein
MRAASRLAIGLPEGLIFRPLPDIPSSTLAAIVGLAVGLAGGQLAGGGAGPGKPVLAERRDTRSRLLRGVRNR